MEKFPWILKYARNYHESVITKIYNDYNLKQMNNHVTIEWIY